MNSRPPLPRLLGGANTVSSPAAGSFCVCVAPRSRSRPVAVAPFAGSSSEMSGIEAAVWLAPPRSKSSTGALVAAAGAAAAPPPEAAPYMPLPGSIERPRAAAFSQSGPAPFVRFFSFIAVCSKAPVSLRWA